MVFVVISFILVTLAFVLSSIRVFLIPKTTPDLPASVAYELLIPNPAIRTLIREKKLAQLQSTMLMARKDGCCILKDSLTALLKDENTNQALVKARLQEIVE